MTFTIVTTFDVIRYNPPSYGHAGTLVSELHYADQSY